MFDLSEVHLNEVWDDDTYNTKSMYKIDWINGMIWLGYFMAGIMWPLNKQIDHCKKKYGKQNAHVRLSFCTVFVILRYSFYW